MQTPLEMHDALLLSAPNGARHEHEVCPFCLDWSLLEDGTPSGLSNGRLSFDDEAAAKAPYGDVKYADPGYQADKVKRYPLDTAAHARSAWSYINQEKNAAKYTAEQVSRMKAAIKAALKKFNVDVSALEGEVEPSTPLINSDAASEGGTNHMDTITQETHQALLEKAVNDAVAALQNEKAALEAKVSELTATTEGLTSEVATLKADNERVAGELDTAQVALKAATDEVASLKSDIAAREEAAARQEIAAARATQVRNLGLFGEDYITEKAARWAEIDEAQWTERLDEWKAAKGASATGETSTTSTTTDTASAMTGTREAKTGGDSSARRKVLGLS